MLSFLSDYGLFLAKTLTIVLALLLLVGGIAFIASRNRHGGASGEISVTSLNERLEDIPLLATHFLSQFTRVGRPQAPHWAPEALEVLQTHLWRGNVRELRNLVERFLELCH